MNTDIDECEVIDDLCGDDTCQNTDGSFICQCADGYILLLPTLYCVDDDECTDPTSCDDTAICTNTDGSYSCSCAEGFKMHTDDTCICLGGNCLLKVGMNDKGKFTKFGLRCLVFGRG